MVSAGLVCNVRQPCDTISEPKDIADDIETNTLLLHRFRGISFCPVLVTDVTEQDKAYASSILLTIALKSSRAIA